MDTAALRQMIRRKMEEKQRAGARLVSRDEAQLAPDTMQQPIVIDSDSVHQSQQSSPEGSLVEAGPSEDGAAQSRSHLQAKQNDVQVAYAKMLLQAAEAPKARRPEKKRHRKISKESIVRKGFG